MLAKPTIEPSMFWWPLPVPQALPSLRTKSKASPLWAAATLYWLPVPGVASQTYAVEAEAV